MNEGWREIPGWPGNEVSNRGRVRSNETVLPATVEGYVWLVSGGRRRREYVPRLVASAFVDPFAGQQIVHYDRDRSNNHAGNLDWVGR